MPDGKAFWFFLAPLLFLIFGCARPDTTLPRPARGYLNLLAKESNLGKAPALIAEVSQTERLWSNSARGERSALLLEAAPVWYWADPSHSLKRDLGALSALGVKGVYLGDVEEDEDIWLNGAQAAVSPKNAPELIGEVVSAGLEAGVNLLAVSGARGPDFILQARNAAGSQGLYAMLAVPRETWDLLPAAADEWSAVPLDANTVAALADAGVIPAKLARDTFNWTWKGGWVSTGEVIGADGQPRRWVYRGGENPREPVMLWQDPSGAARRVLAASVIQRTGLDGVTLAGLRPQAFMGLDSDADWESDPVAALAPGLDAAADLTAQIHRYGGWALMADGLPPEAIKRVLEAGCDFCADDFTPALIECAFKTGSAKPLAALYERLLKEKIPFSRLARRASVCRPDPRLLRSLAGGDALCEILLPDAPRDAKFKAFFARWSLGLPGLAFLAASDLADDEIKALIKNGEAVGRASGKIVEIFTRNQALGVLSRARDSYWLAAGNFSSGGANLQVTLPNGVYGATDAATGEDLSDFLSADATSFRLALDGYQARNVIFALK